MHDSVKSLKSGSKTFFLAACFFPQDKLEAAARIYHWCRYCDDVIDQGGGEATLKFLEIETNLVLHHRKESDYEPFASLKEVSKKYQIPPLYAEELLQGMKMDIQNTFYQSLRDLEVYCYRVASTVGLMMCYILGIFRQSALRHASSLGIAMQLTNICRDVKEDYDIGRIYLPEDLLQEHEVSRKYLFLNDQKLFEVVKDVIRHSEYHYDVGLRGTRYLPMRSAFVITMAAYFYREIGRKILRTGPAALHERTVVSLSRKVWLIFLAVISVLMTIPSRILKDDKLVTIKEVWRPV